MSEYRLLVCDWCGIEERLEVSDRSLPLNDALRGFGIGGAFTCTRCARMPMPQIVRQTAGRMLCNVCMKELGDSEEAARQRCEARRPEPAQ